MKKQLIIVGMIVLLITIGLSGCNETDKTKGDTDKVELVNYNVETLKGVGLNECKSIKGTVKNIAGTLIDKITINVKFYDSNNNLLRTITDYVEHIANSYTQDFEVQYWNYYEYYENVDWDNIKFEFTVS